MYIYNHISFLDVNLEVSGCKKLRPSPCKVHPLHPSSPWHQVKAIPAFPTSSNHACHRRTSADRHHQPWSDLGCNGQWQSQSFCTTPWICHAPHANSGWAGNSYPHWSYLAAENLKKKMKALLAFVDVYWKFKKKVLNFHESFRFNYFRQIQDTIHDGNGVITMTIVALVRSSIWLAANIDLCQSTFELWSRWLIQHSSIILRNHRDTAAIHRSWTWLLFNTSFLDLGQMTGRQFLQCHRNFFGTLTCHGTGQFRACTGAHDDRWIEDWWSWDTGDELELEIASGFFNGWRRCIAAWSVSQCLKVPFAPNHVRHMRKTPHVRKSLLGLISFYAYKKLETVEPRRTLLRHLFPATRKVVQDSEMIWNL